MQERYLRYSRNNFTDNEQEKLGNSTILVAGLGGLGSGVIAALCGLGIGKIIILDYDKIEISNLNRQFIHKNDDVGILKTESAKNWIEQFNPDIEVEVINLQFNGLNMPHIKPDIIADCFDNIESKILLNRFAKKGNTVLVHAGVDGFFGQITTIIPTKTACLECFLAKHTDDFTDIKPVSLAPVVNTLSAMQSNEILKIILGHGNNLEGKFLRVDLLKNIFKVSQLEKNSNCCQ